MLTEPLERLLARFGTSAHRSDSDRLLDEILHRITALTEANRFGTALHYVHQLEPARIGRTFSLFRSPERQERDAQMFRIRRFITDFYRTRATFETARGLPEEAAAMQKVADRYAAMVQKTLQALGTAPVTLLPCFEDDQAATPFATDHRPAPIVPIPTGFYLALPPPCAIGLPFVLPFSFLRDDGPTADVALDPAWTWYLGSWTELPQTLIAGLSPVGHLLVWIAGPLPGNRSLSCSQVGGRWVLTAGDLVLDQPGQPHYQVTNPTPAPPASATSPLRSRDVLASEAEPGRGLWGGDLSDPRDL